MCRNPMAVSQLYVCVDALLYVGNSYLLICISCYLLCVNLIFVKKEVKEGTVLSEIHLRTTGRHLSMGSLCHPGRLLLDLSTP